jgi:hypothetical protein
MEGKGNKVSSTIRTAKKILKPVALTTFDVLAGMEKKLWPALRLRYAPVFIVAPPRSGTTLLYQLMTAHLTTCYFTNLAARMCARDGAPITVFSAVLGKLLRVNRLQGDGFKSYYGFAQGLGGPHEAHAIWDQRFPEDLHAVPPGYLSTQDCQVVYRSVAGIERVFDRPFVNKCIRHSVRIEALAKIFPRAIFIRCVRDRLDVAQSIFVARTQAFPFQKEDCQDPLAFWFSVKPKEYQAIKQKGLVEQVCEQVYYVERSIDVACQTLGDARFLTVLYQDLCQNPRQEIDRVVRFMQAHNAPTEIIKPVPDSFRYSAGRKIDEASYAALADYLSQLYGEPFS